MLMPIECYRELLALADSEEVCRGREWYSRAGREVDKLSALSGLSREQVAGIIAVMSPQVEWSLNLRSAKRFIQAKGKARHIPGFKRNRDKAKAILKNNNLECIRGPKVFPFWKTLLNPRHEVPVIDSQMIAAYWKGEIDREDIGKIAGSKKTEEMREAIVTLAGEKGWSPAEVQAIIWVTWKRLNGRYANQLKLWR